MYNLYYSEYYNQLGIETKPGLLQFSEDNIYYVLTYRWTFIDFV